MRLVDGPLGMAAVFFWRTTGFWCPATVEFVRSTYCNEINLQDRINPSVRRIVTLVSSTRNLISL